MKAAQYHPLALVVASIAAGLAFSSQALAQQALEEVLVTAQKKSAAVMDVPIAMTALGGSDIKDLRLKKIEADIHHQAR